MGTIRNLVLFVFGAFLTLYVVTLMQISGVLPEGELSVAVEKEVISRSETK